MSRSLALPAASLAFILGLGALAFVAPATAAPNEVIVTIPEPVAGPGEPAPGGAAIENAQLRWGLNAEAGSGAFAGGCNFLSAGRAGDAGTARVWGADDALYRPRDGAVRVEKPTANGEWVSASFETRCLDPQGRAVSTATTTSASGNQVVIDGGRGSARPGGGIELRWTGSFTVVFYGGMTYWTVTDPVLTVDAAGSGRLTGTASGYGTSMDDMTEWDRLPERSIVLAEVRGVDTASGGGFSVVPEFLGVGVAGGGQVERTPQNAAHWGSFPQSFVDYQALTGQRAYWLTSGGIRDPAKPASALYVSYDAAAPVPVPAPGGGAAGGTAGAAAPSNPLRRPPVIAAPHAVPSVPTSPVAVNTAMTTVPERQGLVPDAAPALSPVLIPLLGTAAALGVSVLAVLSLLQALPWQRRAMLP